jgi:hypothetical protein
MPHLWPGPYASVTGHAGWWRTELGVLGGYWLVCDGDRLLQAWDRHRHAVPVLLLYCTG